MPRPSHHSSADRQGHDQGPSHSHSHALGHDWEHRGTELKAEAEIGLGWARQAVSWIATLTDAPARILDIGAGPGVHAGLLAEQFPQATVTAVDGSAELLAQAEARATAKGYRIETLQAQLGTDLPALPEADLIWISKVLHHMPDQRRALRELGSRLQPGGLLAVVEGGLPTRFLPDECGVGSPGLLARIEAATVEVIQRLLHEEHDPDRPRPILDLPQQFTEAGLELAGTRSFLLDLPAPVEPQVRRHVAGRLERVRSMAGDQLDPEDARALDRLLDPDDALSVHQRPDLFLLGAATVHTARPRP